MVKNFYPDREFKAFLFDFDGTVADTMPAHLVAWNKALGVHGLGLSLEEHLNWAGRPTSEIVKLLSELHKIELSYEEISKSKEFHYMGSISSVKGIIPVVDIIKVSHGQVAMAIVSGSRRKQVQTTLSQLGMSHFFETLVCAEDYVVGKPAPDCFLKAAAILKVEPKDCLVFEDGNLGIQAALAAGMACLRVSEAPELGHALSKIK